MAAQREVPPASVAGPIASLRDLGATLAAMVGNRVELAVVELREEGERRKEMLVLAVVAALFAALGLLLLALLVVVVFWDSHRIAAAAAVTLLYLGIGAAAIARLQHDARTRPPAFAATLAELERDRQMLQGLHE